MSELSDQLRVMADDNELLWTVPRRAIEEALVDFRDSGISLLGRNNGLVIKYKDGSSSDIIRLGPEDAVRIGLIALADHIEKQEKENA